VSKYGWVEENHVNAVVKRLASLQVKRSGVEKD
jgi:hypothetical protein